MDLHYNNHKKPVNEVLKTMKIIQIDGETVKSFNIDTAYVSLTQSSVFDITKETKVIIHGYKDSAESDVPQNLAKAYNDKLMFNILMVDAKFIIDKWYLLSIHNASLVGKRLANLLANLETYGLNAEDIHLLGISLGAHIAGWTGKYFKKYKGKSIGRITGLDPAGPCFSFVDSNERLDKKDAIYVDVVHSNRLVQGAVEPLGHADFYVNGGGPNQPGCFTSSCSHLRAAMIYIESIRIPQSFIGVKCDNWKQFSENKCNNNNFAILGYGSSLTTRGVYYLRTAFIPPYGLGMEGTKFMSLLENMMKSLSIS